MLNWYPREDQAPLKVAVLCSHRAPGLLEVLRDPRRGELFEVVACISSEHDFTDREQIERQEVPTFVHDIHDFYRSWGARISDLQLRKNYDATILRRLDLVETDIVILCSYLYIVTDALLDAYPNRIVNIHHSDLLDNDGQHVVYPGLHAVRDAIMAGERETRASAHIVTSELDAGPLVARSWGFPVHFMMDDLRRWQATKTIKAYAYAHQEWMIESTWAPLMLSVIDLFARRELQVWNGEVLISGGTRPLELEPPGQMLRSLRAMRTVR